jgi:hypothetical protein
MDSRFESQDGDAGAPGFIVQGIHEGSAKTG